ncbi:MAG: DNA-deoxyinosine glycosylase [Lachnospiraceae bacterium]|nr:DNA-deoxyinosine glycosylase [Lachnospiraceae bacterium]
MNTYEHVSHTFDPVFDKNAKILILGTFPSVKSREQHFYYGHPQNRFWKLLALLLKDSCPLTIAEKKDFLLRHNIAVWDVIESCDIIGSSDSSIKNVVPADINSILQQTDIRAIFANGTKAYDLYQKYTVKQTQFPIIKLPSTSPANAAFSIEKLQDNWNVILQFL